MASAPEANEYAVIGHAISKSAYSCASQSIELKKATRKLPFVQQGECCERTGFPGCGNLTVQALELVAGATNITLLGLNMRDGLRMKGRLRRRSA